MGRLVAFVLGGAAIALYGPYFFLGEESLGKYVNWWVETLGADWYQKIVAFGPGVFAGIALLLFAVRAKE
jgi:hypothetical protein